MDLTLIVPHDRLAPIRGVSMDPYTGPYTDSRLHCFSKAAAALERDLKVPDLPSYFNPPPSYDDAISDLPPDYYAVAPLARQKNPVHQDAPARTDAKSASPFAIDFETPAGVREHKGGKKKKKAAAAPQKQESPPPPDEGEKNDGGGGEDGQNGDAGNDGGAGDGGDGGGGDDGNGGGDGGDDDWGGWATTTTKKKSKKKQKEEEEEMKRKEEEERLAREEEERKAKEEEEQRAADEAAAAAASNNNNLSWADEADGNGDDSWAGFNTVGKKKNKKKGKVRCISPANSVHD